MHTHTHTHLNTHQLIVTHTDHHVQLYIDLPGLGIVVRFLANLNRLQIFSIRRSRQLTACVSKRTANIVVAHVHMCVINVINDDDAHCDFDKKRL